MCAIIPTESGYPRKKERRPEDSMRLLCRTDWKQSREEAAKRFREILGMGFGAKCGRNEREWFRGGDCAGGSVQIGLEII